MASYTHYKGKYAGLLRDERWKDLRWKVIKRDNYCCRICGVSDLPLVAHHFFYKPSLKPWEYDHTMIITLCRSCHRMVHKYNDPNYMGEYAHSGWCYHLDQCLEVSVLWEEKTKHLPFNHKGRRPRIPTDLWTYITHFEPVGERS